MNTKSHRDYERSSADVTNPARRPGSNRRPTREPLPQTPCRKQHGTRASNPIRRGSACRAALHATTVKAAERLRLLLVARRLTPFICLRHPPPLVAAADRNRGLRRSSHRYGAVRNAGACPAVSSRHGLRFRVHRRSERKQQAVRRDRSNSSSYRRSVVGLAGGSDWSAFIGLPAVRARPV